MVKEFSNSADLKRFFSGQYEEYIAHDTDNITLFC